MCNLLAFDASEHKYSSSVYLLTVPHYTAVFMHLVLASA